MPANPRHFATHEAGHAVIQWFVGWESELKKIQMRLVEGGATDAIMHVIPPEVQTLSAARSRLLVLYAGSVASNTRFSTNWSDFHKDWNLALTVTASYLKLHNLEWCPSDGWSVKNREANAILQDTWIKADEIVNHSTLVTTIDAVATLLFDAQPDGKGLCVIYGPEVTDTCERLFGPELRHNNQWSHWLNGL
ncbi:hypothetical protein LCGC14_1833640 [marine sediment metagenome]|uniref:Peptidase M41 domain-containing protein n=1 Tax=marine sediment metagenome TaxID=412755 RepID=A0A0F9IUU6_9ZZZZ